MKRLSLLFSVFVTAATLGLPVIAADDVWKIEPATSSVEFSVKKLRLITVKGHFDGVTGEVHYDGKHLDAADVKTHIDLASLRTGNGLRDYHLRSKDFFNISRFPQASFESSKIETQPDGGFRVTGILRLHGVAEEVVLDAKPLQESVDKTGLKHLTCTANAHLKRKEFGIFGGVTAAGIGNEVTVGLTADLTRGVSTSHASHTEPVLALTKGHRSELKPLLMYSTPKVWKN